MSTTRIDTAYEIPAAARQFAAANPRGFFVVTESGNIKSTFHVERGQTEAAIKYFFSLPARTRLSMTANA